MSQIVSISTLGCEVKVSVPSTVEEFDNLAKKAGAALEDAIYNVLYRSYLAELRDAVCEAIEGETKIERKTKIVRTKKGAEGQPDENVYAFDESEAVYVSRVVANKVSGGEDEAAVKSWLSALCQSIADTLVFDPSAKEKKPAGPKKVSEKYLAAAKKLFDAGRGVEVATKIGAKWGISADGTTVEGLARAIAEDQKRQLAALESQY